MRQNLLETYSRQLKVAEAYVAKNFEGKTMSSNTALTTAVLLDNTNRWITESLNSSIGATNRGDLGAWKKFCLNLTNIAVPSLIANDLVIVHPMTSYSGSVAYLKYVALTDKAGMKGKMLNSVFGHGEMDDARMSYASQVVVETISEDKGSIAFNTYTNAEGAKEAYTIKEGGFKYLAEDSHAPMTATYKLNGEYVNELPELKKGDKVAYILEEFQMEEVPANIIPSIGPKMEHIPLVAEPRRIAVRYDQITAFQAKTDYGFSLDKQIAEQACGELAYEIDTEIVDMLYRAAFAHEDNLADWSKTLPAGVSKFEHYNVFL